MAKVEVKRSVKTPSVAEGRRILKVIRAKRRKSLYADFDLVMAICDAAIYALEVSIALTKIEKPAKRWEKKSA